MKDYEKADLEIITRTLKNSNETYVKKIIELEKDRSILIKLCIAETITIVILDLLILLMIILS